ncbi:MAG TPA: hypothetical protein DIW44_06075 [Anaerolineaceae bacterium]|nr:hypothetical protein [Anaerolineaceae bacterium]
MRNQQIKKVNRIFFSGQDEEKRKWLDQMNAEGWQLISESSFVYSFQRVASEMAENQSSYRLVLGKDFQKSMPLFQEPRQEWVALLSERNIAQNIQALSVLPKLNESKADTITKKRRLAVGAFALLLFIIAIMTKIAIISTGDFLSLFKLQFFTGILFIGSSLVFGMIVLLKNFLKVFSPECKTKK